MLFYLLFIIIVCSALFWTAPELLRSSDGHCNAQMADVYSFAIVVYETLFRRNPYEIDGRLTKLPQGIRAVVCLSVCLSVTVIYVGISRVLIYMHGKSLNSTNCMFHTNANTGEIIVMAKEGISRSHYQVWESKLNITQFRAIYTNYSLSDCTVSN